MATCTPKAASTAVYGQQPIFCVITGASRGIGRHLAIGTAKILSRNTSRRKSRLVIVARSLEKLQETKSLIRDQYGDRIEVSLVSRDLSDVSGLQSTWDAIISEASAENYSDAILVNNVADLTGDIGRMAGQHTDASLIQKALNLNFTGYVLFISYFMQYFKTSCQCTVVNLTSLLGRLTTNVISLYSSIQAAREQYIRNLVNSDFETRAFSLDPGMVDTDMLATGTESFTEHFPSIAKVHGDIKSKGCLTSPETVVNVFLDCLENPDHYKNGEIVIADEPMVRYQVAIGATDDD
ncbi:sepiapterin reductase-like [Saccoglossus kowalevskii]|uniref:Sepiapterin reductase-like n=1 Tax=Saccoglossus kowalevskii TaxID=10224 RepID=A0ABM0M5U3_SACKO|nr:PREDICTED: sepiapterin reductase-like [Saccoglossus kowalevskii]